MSSTREDWDSNVRLKRTLALQPYELVFVGYGSPKDSYGLASKPSSTIHPLLTVMTHSKVWDLSSALEV